MRRRRFAAASVLILVTAFAIAPTAAAAPRAEGFDLARITGFLLGFFWNAAPVAQQPESAVLADGVFIDPWGVAPPPAPSGSVPPPRALSVEPETLDR